MTIEETPCARAFARLCADGVALGWHEANGGNLSYRMTSADVAACGSEFATDAPWQPLAFAEPSLGGSFFMVTGSGKYLRNVDDQFADAVGIIELNDDGSAWRLVWGLESTARPTSELPTHLMNHAIRMRATNGADRVIYHSHCPNVIALSTILPPDARIWSRALWQCMTEVVMLLPQGVGVVPWMVPGSTDIARATAACMETQNAVVWTQHGMFVAGASFDDAFGRMHVVEKAAGLYLSARAASGGHDPEFLIPGDHLRAVCESLGVAANEQYLD